MLKKSSAYKKVVCSICTCLLLQTVSTAIPAFTNTALAVSPITASLGSTATNHATPSSIDFPGSIKPGEAKAKVTENGFNFSNNVLNAIFTQNGSDIKLDSIENKVSKEIYDINMSKLVDLTLSNNSHISASDMTIKKAPTLLSIPALNSAIRLSDRDAGQKIQTIFEYNKNGIHFELTWNIILRNNSNNIRQEFTFNAIGSDVNIKDYKLFDLSISDKTAVKVNNDAGSPVTFNNLFMGLESPLANVQVKDNSAQINIGSKNTISQGQSRTYTTGIGISPEGQMKRAFRYYLERERIHFRRPLLMYNSWWTFPMNDYDQNHADLKPGETVQPTEKQLTDYINMYGNALGSRGVTVDSYQIDDGWDNIDSKPVWSFNKTSLPNEFHNLKETAASHNGQLGVWMSPFGGYAGSDHRVLANQDLGPVNWKFKLSNEAYYKVFKDRVVDMIRNQGVTAFKFDGVGKGLQSEGPDESTFQEYENLLKLLIEMRELKPDVFVYCTVGTWASPYWLWYTDSIWRDDSDQGLTGEGTGRPEAPGIQDREKWINYRDNGIHKHNVVENPFMTINELMTHGVAYSTHSNYVFNNDLSQEYVRTSFLNDMKMLFALGGSLEELHIQKDQIDKLTPELQNFVWDNLAKNIKWAQSNFSLLSDNQWVGGSPSKGEVYGFASWSKEKAILSLRNPSNSEKTFTVDPEQVFNIPQGEAQTYIFKERDGVKEPVEITAGKPLDIKLKPFEVLVFEAIPKNIIPTSTSTSSTASNNGRHLGILKSNGNHRGIYNSNGNHRGISHLIDNNR